MGPMTKDTVRFFPTNIQALPRLSNFLSLIFYQYSVMLPLSHMYSLISNGIVYHYLSVSDQDIGLVLATAAKSFDHRRALEKKLVRRLMFNRILLEVLISSLSHSGVRRR